MNTQPPVITPLKPTVGVGIVIVRGCDVLLIKRGRPPGMGKWNIPGGRQEAGETVRETAVREALEETGLHVTNLRLIDVVDIVHRDDTGAITAHWTLVDFRADAPTGEAVAGDDAAAVEWVKVSDLASYELWPETDRIVRAAAEMT